MLSSKGKIRVGLEKKKILCREVGSDSIRRISRLFEETKGPEICTYLASNNLSESQRKVDAL